MRINKYTTLKGKDNIPELVKDFSVNYSCEKLLHPDEITEMMNDIFKANKQTEEICHILCLNQKMKVQGIFEVSRGTVNSSCLNPREIFMKALLCGAVSIIVVHNHPSGDTAPSKEDINVTKRIKKAGEIIGIGLLDHIIIGDGYYSFLENDLI